MRIVLTLWIALLLAGCGSDPPKAPAGPEPTPEAAAKARLEAMFSMVSTAKTGDARHLAPFIVYRGADEARRHKDAAKYEGDEVRQIDHVFARVRRHLAVGTPVFVSSETRSKGSESWVAWTITFGTGAATVKTLYALVRVGDTWLVGDIDGG